MDLRGLTEYNIPLSSNIINDAHLQSASLKRSRSRSLSYTQDNCTSQGNMSLDQILAQDTSAMSTIDPDIFFNVPADNEKRDATKRPLEATTSHDNEKKPRLSLLTEQASNNEDGIANLPIIVVDHEQPSCSRELQAHSPRSDNSPSLSRAFEHKIVILPSVATKDNSFPKRITSTHISLASSNQTHIPHVDDDNPFFDIKKIIELYEQNGHITSCLASIQQLFQQNPILHTISEVPAPTRYHVLHSLMLGQKSDSPHGEDEWIIKTPYSKSLHHIVGLLSNMKNKTGSPNSIARIMTIIKNICNKCAAGSYHEMCIHSKYRECFVHIMQIIVKCEAISIKNYKQHIQWLKTQIAELSQLLAHLQPQARTQNPFNIILDYMGEHHFKDLLWFIFAHTSDNISSNTVVIPYEDTIFLHMLLDKIQELQSFGLSEPIPAALSPFINMHSPWLKNISLSNPALLWLRQICTTCANKIGIRTPITKRTRRTVALSAISTELPQSQGGVMQKNKLLLTINKQQELTDLPNASTLPEIFALHTSFHEVSNLSIWLSTCACMHDHPLTQLINIPIIYISVIQSIYDALTYINQSCPNKSDLCTDSIEWEMLASTIQHIHGPDPKQRWTTLQNIVSLRTVVTAIRHVLRDNDPDAHLHMQIIKRKSNSQPTEMQQIVRKAGRAAMISMYERMRDCNQDATTLTGSFFYMYNTIINTVKTTDKGKELLGEHILRKLMQKRSGRSTKLYDQEIQSLCQGLKTLLDNDVDTGSVVQFPCHVQSASLSIEKSRNDIAIRDTYPRLMYQPTSAYVASNEFFALPPEGQIDNLKNNPCILQLIKLFSVDKLQSIQKALSESKRHVSFESEHGLVEIERSTSDDIATFIQTILSFSPCVSGFKEHRRFEIIDEYLITGKSFSPSTTILLPSNYTDMLKQSLQVVEAAHQIITDHNVSNLYKIQNISIECNFIPTSASKCFHSRIVFDSIGELILRDLVCWLFYKQQHNKQTSSNDNISLGAHRSTQIKHLVQTILNIDTIKREALWKVLPLQLAHINTWVTPDNTINSDSLLWLYNAGSQLLRVNNIPFPTDNQWGSRPLLDETTKYINKSCSSTILFSLKQFLFDRIHNDEIDAINLLPIKSAILHIFQIIQTISNDDTQKSIPLFRDNDVKLLSTISNLWSNQQKETRIVITRNQAQQIMNLIEALCFAICNRAIKKIPTQ